MPGPGGGGDNESISDSLKKWWKDVKTEGLSKATSKAMAADAPASAALSDNNNVALPLGPFEATDKVLGEGGYAKVMLGKHRGTGEKVAIKLVDTRGDQTSGRAAMSEAAIVREVAALRRAGAHPNVCQLLGYYRLGDGGTCHAMVMELCSAGELFRLVERFGAVEEEKIHPIFLGMLAGVKHLHEQGIAHRDLKLENILLARVADKATGNTMLVPKICDLGLAHAHARGADGQGWAARELTQFCGSRSYCAPEVLARLGYDGYLADVWSLGVCLFGLVSGFFPVDEATSRDWRFERLARQQHVAPDQSTSAAIFGFYGRQCPLSPALVQLLDGMLQVAPARRARLAQVIHAPWVRGSRGLAAAAEASIEAAVAQMSVQDFLIDVEVDVSEPLQRGGGDGVEAAAGAYRSLVGGDDAAGPVYRSAGGPVDAGFDGGAAPPRIRRQKGENDVGMLF